MIVKQFLLQKVDFILYKIDPFLEKWFGMPNKIPAQTRKNRNLALFSSLFMFTFAVYYIYNFLIGKDSILSVFLGISWFLSASSSYRIWVIIRK